MSDRRQSALGRTLSRIRSNWDIRRTSGHRERLAEYTKINTPIWRAIGVTEEETLEAIEEANRPSILAGSAQGSRDMRDFLYPASFDMTPVKGIALFAFVRTLKPHVFLETGVGNGVSSASVLRAIRQNGFGVLHSIDDPPLGHFDDPRVGAMVPVELRACWRLHRGSSRNLLGQVLEETGPIDSFLHDSDHSYRNMLYEFHTVWPVLRPGAWLFSDDVTSNDAFLEFAEFVGCHATVVELSGVSTGIGVLRKP